MTRPVRLSGLAALDLQQARDWFDGQEAGLGDRFLASVAQTLERISTNADQYQIAVLALAGALFAIPVTPPTVMVSGYSMTSAEIDALKSLRAGTQGLISKEKLEGLTGPPRFGVIGARGGRRAGAFGPSVARETTWRRDGSID